MATWTWEKTLTIENPGTNPGKRKLISLTSPKVILRPPPVWDKVKDIVSPRELIMPEMDLPKRKKDSLFWIKPKRKVLQQLKEQQQ